MRILELVAENFKKIRVVEIQPDGRLIQVTGRNGQGKTSVIDSIFFALKGKKALPAKPAVRKGAEKMRVALKVGGEDLEFMVVRTLGAESELPTLQIEMLKGKRETTPQEFLDDIFGALTFDPLAFINMDTAAQIVELRKTAKVDLDFEAIADANEKDYEERGKIHKEIQQLDGQVKGIQFLEGLPAQKIDEARILEQLNAAGETNRKAQEIFQAREQIGAAAARIAIEKVEQDRRITQQLQKIDLLKVTLQKAEAELLEMASELELLLERHKQAEQRYREAPAGELVDVGALTAELQAAQRTNRAIEARERAQQLQKQIDAKKRAAEEITRRMDDRNEKKRLALAKAEIPVPGLVFDERKVLYNGLPLENLGEGEQIRISTLIGMAANPKLRVMCIRHGEALDEDGLKVLAQMAEEHDFQVWMSRVDSSGKVGLVLEDGMIVSRNEREC